MDPSPTPDFRRPRPYRSKRLRPCDVCRRRKHACRLEGRPPCTICRGLGVACTFNNPPSKRQPRESPAVHPAASRDNPLMQESWSLQDSSLDFSMLGPEMDFFRDLELPQLSHQGFSRQSPAPLVSGIDAREIQNPVAGDMRPSALERIPQLPSTPSSSSSPRKAVRRLSTNDLPAGADSQVGQSLDKTEGYSVQYFGPSGEMDPYLLRHFHFADAGTTRFFKAHYRQMATEVPNDIPVHFRLTAHDPQNPSTGIASTGTSESRWELLETLVPVEVGARLVGLFFRYVFPSFPVLSRTAFRISTDTLIPDLDALNTIPTSLLAAVYASAHQFARYDPLLSVSGVCDKVPIQELWRLASDGIYGTQLSTLQTVLLYLQKPPSASNNQATLGDPPSHASLLGTAMSLATNMGLHIDCTDWPIPSWEKRLRRRLWWTLYSETTWGSLLLGSPHLIHEDTWDVSHLNEQDFVIDNLVLPNLESYMATSLAPRSPCVYCHRGHDFVFLAGLAGIAHDVTLRATRTLAQDFAASLELVKPLLDRLRQWEGSLPPYLRIEGATRPKDKCYFHLSSGAHLKLAFLTVNVFVYRALMRPLGGEGLCINGVTGLDHFTSPDDNRIWPRGMDSVQTGVTLSVRRALEFTRKLDALDRTSFWFSWCPICFTTISNFIVLLLIQSPDVERAKEYKHMLDIWTQTLRLQSVVFDQVHMGLLNLDAMIYVGLEKVFRCPPYVLDILRDPISGLPSTSPAQSKT